MSGPLDLRGRVIITDGATPTLQRIQNGLASIAREANKKAAAVSGAAGTIATGVGGYGLMRVLQSAEEFQRKVYGVGAASISENTKRVTDATTGTEKVVVDLGKVRAAMSQVEEMALRVARETSHTPSRIAGIAEVLAKAGFGSEKLEAAARTLATVSSTDLETPVGKIAEFATILDAIYKPQDGEKWAQFFKRHMDIVSVAANETRLSVGSMMEGLRPFSALYKVLGGNERDSALMLMAGIKEGAEATELGHTLKSNAVRFLRMTQPAQSRFSALGMRRSDYGDMSSVDPMQATGALARLFPAAGISGKFRKELNEEFSKAIEGGFYDSDDFHQRIQNKIAEKAGVDTSNEQSRERFADKYNNAVFSGIKVDMLKLYQDLIKKGATPGDLAMIFEGRRIGVNIQLFEGLKKWGDQFTEKLRNATGVGVDATQQIYQDSSFGKLQRLYSMLEAFQIKLAESAGFEIFLNSVTRFFDLLGQMPKPLADLTTTAAVLAVALAPLAATIGLVAASLTGLYRVLKKLGAATTLPKAVAAPVGGMTLGTGAGVGAAAAAGGGGVLGMMWRKRLWSVLSKGFKGGMGALTLLGLLGAVPRERSEMAENIDYLSAKRDEHRAAGRHRIADNLQQRIDTMRREMENLPQVRPGSAGAAAPPASGSDRTGGFTAPGLAGTGQGEGANAADETAQAMARAQDVIRAVNFVGEGRRMMAELAQGIREGIGEVDAAISQAASSVRAGAARVRLNTGPAMRGAN